MLGTQNEFEKFEIAVVNEPSVFEPLKFYCICILSGRIFFFLHLVKSITETGYILGEVTPPYFFHYIVYEDLLQGGEGVVGWCDGTG